MKHLTILNYKSSYFYLHYICLVYSITQEAVSNFIEYIFSSQSSQLGFPIRIPHDAMADTITTDPEKWREKLKEAPEKLLKPHEQNFWQKGTLTLDPKYVVGLVDSEGCFSISFAMKGKPACEFSISLTSADANIIHSLKNFFKVGKVYDKAEVSTFTVNRDWQLYFAIIPFFDQHPLLGRKRIDYLFFRQVVIQKIEEPKYLASPKLRPEVKYIIANYVYTFFSETEMKRQRKLSLEDLRQNLGIPRKGAIISLEEGTYSELPMEYINILAFSYFFALLTPFIKPAPWYVTGYYEGDGGSCTTITPERIIHTLNCGSNQVEILYLLQNFFECGNIYLINKSLLLTFRIDPTKVKVKLHWRLLINKVDDLHSSIKNHLDTYPMYCSKQTFYLAFMEVVEAVHKKEHLDRIKRKELFFKVNKINLDGKRKKIKEYTEELFPALGEEGSTDIKQ